ncbi:MAG: hypothetical protein U9P38_06700 [Campylobacterota bacterium]|nr:hypothetical protein [Campylobacterota bacterium]
MNSVNPLHIALLLLVVLSFISFKLIESKQELVDIKNSYQETHKVALELRDLKKVYADKKRLKRSLQRVLKLPSLRQAEIVKIDKKSEFILSSKSMDKKALNSLMGKILNGNFNIKIVKIKRLNEKKVSLYMEIKW